MLSFLYYFIYKNYTFSEKVTPFLGTNLFQFKKWSLETNHRILFLSLMKLNMFEEEPEFYTDIDDIDEIDDDFFDDFFDSKTEFNECLLSNYLGLFFMFLPFKLFTRLKLKKFLKRKRLLMKRKKP